MQVFNHLYGSELVEFKQIVVSQTNRQFLKDMRTLLTQINEVKRCRDYYHGEPIERVKYRLQQELSIYRRELDKRGLKLNVPVPFYV